MGKSNVVLISPFNRTMSTTKMFRTFFANRLIPVYDGVFIFLSTMA